LSVTEIRPAKKAKFTSNAVNTKTSSSCSSGIQALASEILSSRLEQFASKQQEYISHLVRDRNQSCFKGLTEETMNLHGFYVLMDYWAKLNSRNADVACCDGNQIGLSTHGMMSGWFIRHAFSFCPNRSEPFEERKKARQVDAILQSHDARTLQEHKERINRLSDVTVHLRGYGRVGMKVDSQSNSVAELNEKDLAFLSGKIDKGFIVTSINGAIVSPNQLSLIDEELCAGKTLDITFKRPAPPLPLHGIARKGIHKLVPYFLHEQQLDWLGKNVYSGGRALLRDKPAADAMKAFFHSTLREDTMTPMWLDQDRISTWLSARVREEKDRRKAALKAAKSSGPGFASASASKKAPPTYSSDESDNGSSSLDSDSLDEGDW